MPVPDVMIADKTVRYAQPADIDRIVDLARREHAASVWANRVAFSPQHAKDTIESFLWTPMRTIVMTDGGYLLGLVQSVGFSPVLAAMEYAWYAEDGSGLALLKEFDQWAKRMGAQTLIVHDYFTASEEQSRLSGVLRRRYNFTSLGTALFRTTGIPPDED
jgi:hypothetical protein